MPNNHDWFSRPKRVLGLVATRKRATFAVAALVLAALAAALIFSPLRGVLKERAHRPALVATESQDEKHAEAARPLEESCLVRAQVVGSARDSRNYVYSGEVRGRYESVLAFQAGGRIVKRNVQLGDAVRAGDVLMEIDPKDIREAVALGSAQVRSAEAQVRLAEVNLGRFKRLYSQAAVAKAQLDQYQMAYDVAVAALDQASALHAETSHQLEYSRLRADKEGVIAGISAEVGQVVAPGIPVLTLVHDGDREIEISVPESRIDSLRNVESIKVTFWALPGVELAGAVREMAPMADPVLRTYKTRIRLLSPTAEIKLGMTASVGVEQNGEGRRIIPLSAVFQEKDSPNVWVVKDDKLELRPVELDGFGDDTVRVVKGLEDGDVIVTAGVHKLMPGQRVRVSTGEIS